MRTVGERQQGRKGVKSLADYFEGKESGRSTSYSLRKHSCRLILLFCGRGIEVVHIA